MRTRCRCLVAVVVACLALPTIGLAQPPGSQLPDTVAGTASGAAAELPAVAVPAQATAAPVVYLVQPQAAVAAPSASPSSGIGAVLKAVPIDTWALVLGVLAMVVLQLLGARGATVRSKVDFWIDAAYYAAEAAARAAPDNLMVAKMPTALDAFHQGLTGDRIAPTATLDAKAQAAWRKMAEKEHVETEIRARAAAQAAAETKPESAGALLDAAAKA